MKKILYKITGLIFLMTSCFCLFSCDNTEKDCMSMKYSNGYDETVTVKIDDKETDASFLRYDGKEYWIYPEPAMKHLKTNTISKGNHQLSLEFKEGLERCEIRTIRLLTNDGEWYAKASDGVILDFQYQENSAQGTFIISEGMEKEYNKLFFELDVSWHFHKKDVCYRGNGYYYFGVGLV